MAMYRLPPLALATGLAAALALAPARAATVSLSTGRVQPGGDGYGAATTTSLRIGGELADLGFAELDLDAEVARDTGGGDAPGGRRYSFTSLGAYLSARTAGAVYLIGRYGVARNELDIDGGPTTTATQQSVGVGAGASTGAFQLELMATRHLEAGGLADVTWVTAGVRF